VTGSGSVYNIAVSGMTGDGTVIVDIASGVCTDILGKKNLSSINTDNTVTYDESRPIVEINQASGQTDPTSNSPINFTATFSEDVEDFINLDVSISGTSGATTVVVTGSGAIYNIEVSGMTGDGTVIVNITESVCTDLAGNDNIASTNTDNTVTYDGTRPTVLISSIESGSTDLTDIPVTIEFSEPVQGFSLDDINLTNTNISAFIEVNLGQKWTANLNPVNQGIIEMSINADIATDNANNGNMASNLFSITYVLANQAPIIQNQQFSINEDSEAGIFIGTVIATDEDNDNISFDILSGNTDDAFNINKDNGEISLSTSNILDYEKQTEYLLTVEVTDDNPNVLSAQAIITITIVELDEKLAANNIITPNDIRNKFWIIEDIQNYADYELTIRTATGQVVYKTINYQNNWAGTYNNKNLPIGTYYYTLISTINRNKYSGFINLIRN
ncbi:MAG: cadherin domain-containing protein, partial [Candidatus Aureabacteria bacterium]|nr:cadherin domain-containing protein [Candidatus Auribacterota bacterium]